MLGRISKVAAGVTVGLVAAAPMAWAGGTGHDDVKGDYVKGDKDHSKHEDKDKDGDHHEWDGHDHGHHFSGKACSFDGGDAGAASEITGDSLANVLVQAPVAGNQIANLANCSDFLNDNLNGNLSGNNLAIL